MSASEAQKRATAKHLKEQYKELRFRVKKDQAQAIENYASSLGLSFRAYVLGLIEQDMAGGGSAPEAPPAPAGPATQDV